jgi:hypothetical protein
MDASAKKTAQVLVDFYTNISASDEPDDEDRAFDDAFTGLEDAGAFTVEVDEEDEIELEITPLLIGSTVTVQWLIGQLSAATDYSEEEILFDLRHFIGNLPVDE